VKDRELWVWAATVWGEARGEPLLGQVAVAWVVENRRRDDRWPDSHLEVCVQPAQFSVWWDEDVISDLMGLSLDSPGFDAALYSTLAVRVGQMRDPTKGATHYYNPDLASPGWAEDMVETARIGRHRFMVDRLTRSLQ